MAPDGLIWLSSVSYSEEAEEAEEASTFGRASSLKPEEEGEKPMRV